MSDRDYLVSLVKEADLYKEQGLLVESKGKYVQALQFLRKSEVFRGEERVEKVVRKRIKLVEQELEKLKQDQRLPQLPKGQKELIKELFRFSEARETSAIEGAVALAHFGQYEEAIEEFRTLLKKGTLPIIAAKNIIRCYMSLSLPGAAIAEFEDWVSSGLMSSKDLEYLREFLKDSLKNKGITLRIPELNHDVSETVPFTKEEDEDLIQISAIRIEMDEGPLRGHCLDLDVNFQVGNILKVIVSSQTEEVLEAFRLGTRFSNIQFYSNITVFRGSGVVSRKLKIEKGERKGDYSIDITIEDA
ncbi:MAG: hypothetical protein JRI79_09935 [Deltaproteobacteria bacterium]|nr:hypothetical protein [Deltaproteobacteria bacterium]MBW1978267.1 hypothetical protein [Deltaproteobacteria bacterium]MBW2300841.1 hypothetical protein [Deltaproteobacteria bacterium]RLB35289.1 MAG: hypothetical protein DRH11_03340 [Deltaproteobacteria bacterium]